MTKTIKDLTAILAIIFLLTAGLASAQDQAAASFERAFSPEKHSEFDFQPVVDSWDRFLQEPRDYYFTHVRFSFVRQMGAPLISNTQAGHRTSQALAFAGWDQFISQNELKLATPKGHLRIALK